MPASDISRLSVSGAPRSDVAASYAKDAARREIAIRIKGGLLKQDDQASIAREYRAIYSQEYYKYFAFFSQQPRIVYVQTEKQPAKKFPFHHTVANFSKLNCFIHVHRDCITVGKIIFPIDEDISPETKEAFLNSWPGPLDKHDEQLKRKVTDYIDTLWQHDSQRRIKYCISTNDDQRKTILKLLTELLHRNGTIDAPGITRLLLKSEQTEIQKDEGTRNPLITLQKYLLLGKRSEAIIFAKKNKKLWDHALCLAFLDKYQPPNTGNYVKDGLKLKDDFLVQLNDEYINSIDDVTLNIVYRSLMNRIIQSDPESLNIIKHKNVESNYEFAILSANDCEMEFDQTNEIFKLIVAVKQAILNPVVANSHLIALGYTSIDTNDPGDDLSHRSHLSFKQGDTYTSKTLTISNIDMLTLNETWEYCLNLARGTCNPTNYDYIINLVPYKLIFASRLFDLGLHEMFANYLSSIKNALIKAKSQQFIDRDPFYDWDTIEKCVEHLSRIGDIFRMSPETLLHQQTPSPESQPQQPHNIDLGYNSPSSFTQIHSLPNQMLQNEQQSDYIDSSHNDNLSIPYQGESISTLNQNFSQVKHNIPPPLFNQRPIPEVNDFNPESAPISPRIENRNLYEPQHAYDDYSNQPSRRQSTSQSMEMPIFSPPSFGPPGVTMSDRNQKTMKSSSPVNKNRDLMQLNSMMGESFTSPVSPINEYDDLPKEGSDYSRRTSACLTNAVNSDQMITGSNASSSNNSKSLPAGDQQPNFLLQLVGSAKALLPKSNSKQMILPDDNSKAIVYDDERRTWVDTTQPDGADNNDLNDAPPIMNVSQPPSYSFVTKSSKTRYPKAQF